MEVVSFDSSAAVLSAARRLTDEHDVANMPNFVLSALSFMSTRSFPDPEWIAVHHGLSDSGINVYLTRLLTMAIHADKYVGNFLQSIDEILDDMERSGVLTQEPGRKRDEIRELLEESYRITTRPE